jgi:hypothetical protein
MNVTRVLAFLVVAFLPFSALGAPVIDPVVVPKGDNDPLDAPLRPGADFVGGLNRTVLELFQTWPR